MSAVATESLLAGIDAAVEPNAPLGKRTYFSVGGCADFLASPRSEAALVDITRRCAEAGVPLRVLGEGANLLVDDDGVDGVVICLDQPCFRERTFDRSADGVIVQAGAGLPVSQLIRECGQRALGGLEQLTGIPATLGGALRMNAGGRWGDIAQSTISLRLVGADAKVRTISASDAGFAYRHTSLPAGIITGAALSLRDEEPLELRKRIKEISAIKAASQPLAANSAGCMFRNPIDSTGRRLSAGALIDEAGLKGLCHGTAQVSPVHGNFITIKTGGSPRHAVELSEQVAQRVHDRHGIRLDREVVFWRRGGSE